MLDIKLPQTEMNMDYFQFLFIKFAKLGYGTIEELKQLDIQTFFNIIHYENYCNEWQTKYEELNGR